MELEITWKRAAKVWWAYLWRNLIAIVIAMIVGGLLGFALGFILAVFGVSSQNIQLVTGPLGAIAGLLISIVPIKMILGKDFGEFRLVLVQKDSSDTAI